MLTYQKIINILKILRVPIVTKNFNRQWYLNEKLKVKFLNFIIL